MTSDDLTPGDLAEARHRAYALFGQVFVQGLTDDVHARLAILPAVADVVVTVGDAAAADHHRTLSLDVLPFASVFLDARGLLGGPASAATAGAYAAGGFAPDLASTEPDHVGLQLAYLAHLCAAEGDARADGAGASVNAVMDLQRGFLDEHLLRWLPAFVVALEDQATCLWLARVGRLALELAALDRARLGRPRELSDLPLPTLDLTASGTGVKDIVDHLVRPALSGLYLSRVGLGQLAAAADLPAGFGPRKKMLETLWFTAVDHQRVGTLVSGLLEVVTRSDHALRAMATLGLDVDPWRTRLTGTRDQLERIAAAV